MVGISYLVSFLFSVEESREDAGVFPEAGAGAAGSAGVAGLVRSAVHSRTGTESHLLSILLPPVGRHLPGVSAQLPQRSLPVHAYPNTAVARHCNIGILWDGGIMIVLQLFK